MNEHSIVNLPFSVRIVKSPGDLQKVGELRQKAYGGIYSFFSLE